MYAVEAELSAKMDCYNYRMFYVCLMVTTKQNLIVDIQKIIRKESKQKIIKSQKMRAREEGRNKEPTKHPEKNFKRAIVSLYQKLL